uniref:peptidylprolyl isomerase n=1 Tax=Latimeria chalumnae TaxID=7897 RepID=H3A4P3_LATCH
PLEDVLIERKFVPESCARTVQSGDFVRYHYHGTLPDGNKFDSSYDRGSTFNVFVGKGELIAGMDKALVGMCVNERSFIKVPPHLAYGSEGVCKKPGKDENIWFEICNSCVWMTYMENRCSEVMGRPPPSPLQRDSGAGYDSLRWFKQSIKTGGWVFVVVHTRLQTYDTYIGIGWLIAGMDEGLLGMCVGEKRIITIPPFLAYGENGDGRDIPAQASLVFDVALLDLHNPNDDVTIEDQEVPETCQRKSKEGDFVRYHYNGTFLDGTLFDSSYSRKHTYDTYIGKGYVIAGMDKSLLDVCVGEKRRIIIPPHLAYGEEGTDKIPGSAVLVFDIHIIDFHNPSDTVEVKTIYKPADCTVTSKKRDYLKYQYNASLLDGTRLDSIENYGKTYNVVLGIGQVIVGMDVGLKDMCVGEKRTVIIPPHLGYGEQGIEGEIPGSAVLSFDIELIDLVQGLPEGYMFIWNEEVSPDLFEEMDQNRDGKVLLEEFSDYINVQVNSGKGKLAPGFDPKGIIENMFSNQDRNADGIITAEEFKLKDQEPKAHDEL